MKQKSYSLVSLILAVMLSIAPIRCGVAAEIESGDKIPEKRINLRKTEAERKADFDKALMELPYTVPDLDKIAFQDGLKRSKNNFIRLYRSQWKSLGMADKLKNAINASFDDNTKDLTLGTTGLQIASNWGNIVDKIQEAVAFKFAEDFDEFLRDLEEKWAGTLQKDVSDFYHRTSVLLLALDNNPMTQAYIRQSSAAQDKGQDVMERVKASLEEKYSIGQSGEKFVGGLASLILRDRINKIIGAQLGKTALRKFAGTGVQKIASSFVPAIGWALIGWTIWDIGSMAIKSPNELMNTLQEQNLALYSTEIPEIYWDAMEPYVMDTFVFSYEKLQKAKKEANMLSNDPLVVELSKGLNDDDAIEFAQRISALSEVLGKAGNENLLKDFGEFIRDSSRKDFRLLSSMLQQENKLQVKEWFKIAGARFFDIYDSFSCDVWENFPPNKESLEALAWMTKLPPKARRVAVQLSISDIRWIMEELPERFVSQLFGGDEKKSEDIHNEIGRLAALPDKESRVPWQSAFSYWWTLYGFYVKIVVAILIMLLVLRYLLSLKNLVKKEKESKPLPGASSIVNINIPAYPSTSPSVIEQGIGGRKKYNVKLLISAEFAPKLTNIIWDISQEVFPAEVGSESRILSVELDSLNKIAKWIAENKNDIKVMQPDELKGEVERLCGKGDTK